MPTTRAFLAAGVNARGGAKITADGIIFFNGLGDAVSKVFGYLRRETRVLGPSPAYSTLSSAEVFNRDSDENFNAYVRNLIDAKRLEVCSTGPPQLVIPEIFGDSRYRAHLERRAAMFESRANEAYEAFPRVRGVRVSRPRGALYFTVVFEEGVLNAHQHVPVASDEVRELIEKRSEHAAPDKRFVYWLLAATGICVVSLSGFACSLPGFRITLLETEAVKRRWIHRTIAASIEEYLSSGPGR